MEAIEDLVVGKQECLGGVVDKSALKACSDEVEVQYVVFWLELIYDFLYSVLLFAVVYPYEALVGLLKPLF